jgi:hypothetical protein
MATGVNNFLGRESMRNLIVAASIAITALLLPGQPAVAAPTLTLTVIGGGGVLSDGSTFAVNAMSLAVSTPRHNVARQTGGLVIDGVRTKCSIASVVTCTQATLTCDDSSTHDVTAGVPGGALGSFDGVDLTDGFIHMQCVSH